MNRQKSPPAAVTDRGVRVALIFALAAERLAAYYEHGQWLTEGQGASRRLAEQVAAAAVLEALEPLSRHA